MIEDNSWRLRLKKEATDPLPYTGLRQFDVWNLSRLSTYTTPPRVLVNRRLVKF